MDDAQFERIRDYFAYSREGYRKVRKGVKKRLARHMLELGCRTAPAYIEALERNEEARTEAMRRFTVSISRFFRDRRLWELLEAKVLPMAAEDAQEEIRVWSAGCARGEEVYSLRIVWERLRSTLPLPPLRISATDLNPLSLEAARKGIYGSSGLRELSEEIRNSFFTPLRGGKRFAVSAGLREGIDWRLHDFMDEPPGTDYHMVFLRNNLLTYYRGRIRDDAFRRIASRIRPRGFIAIGSHERLPNGDREFVPFEGCPFLYRRSTP
jgi:chemotaxis protein methyltransferase CheR